MFIGNTADWDFIQSPLCEDDSFVWRSQMQDSNSADLTLINY